MQGSRQLCAFGLGETICGIELQHIREIAPAQELATVPLAPPVVAGVLHLRGHVLTALDLRCRLGMAPRSESADWAQLVVQLEHRRMSLVVDEVHDVLEVGPAQFEPPPVTLHESLRRYLHGVYKLENGLLLSLNLAAVAQIGVRHTGNQHGAAVAPGEAG